MSDRPNEDDEINALIKEHVIFVGNPGVGKSTLLNMMCNAIVFMSGVSFGSGMTKYLQTREIDRAIFSDTPGLDDMERRKEAAHEIGNALKQNGRYKLFFVVLLHAGRALSADAATIRLVLAAINVNVPFGLIINKLSDTEYEGLHDQSEPHLQKVLAQLLSTCKRAPSGVYLMKKNPDLDDKNNQLPPQDPKFISFVKDMRTLVVKPENVSKIKYNEYEELEEKLNVEIKKMSEDNQALQKALEDMVKQSELEHKKHLEDIALVKQETDKKLEELKERQQQEMARMNTLSEQRLLEIKREAEERRKEDRAASAEERKLIAEMNRQAAAASAEKMELMTAQHNQTILLIMSQQEALINAERRAAQANDSGGDFCVIS